MSRLAAVQKKKTKQPARVVIYGEGGVGKSTFGDDAPESIFISPEGGTSELTRGLVIPNIKTFQDVLDAVKELTLMKHEYKTLVIDSADWLEKLCHAEIISDSGKSIITVHGGYMAGYRMSEQNHRRLMIMLNELREKGMAVVVTGHYEVKKVKDPYEPVEYERYQLKCQEMVSALWHEWADAFMFARIKKHVRKGDKESKTRVTSKKEHVMYTEDGGSFQAKNRYGLPPELPLSWQAFEAARDAANARAGILLEEATKMLAEVDEKLKERAAASIKKATGNAKQLQAIIDRFNELKNPPEPEQESEAS